MDTRKPLQRSRKVNSAHCVALLVVLHEYIDFA